MHMLLLGAWPELASRLVGLPARITLVQLPGKAADRDGDVVHRLVEIDYTDVDRALSQLVEMHDVDRFDVVVALRELALPVAHRLATRLDVRSVPGPASSFGKHKAAIRALCNEGGCEAVPFRLCHDIEELRAFVSDLGYPAILKAVWGTASVGVHAIHTQGDVDDAWSHCLATAGDPPYLAEQLVKGLEYSVETLSREGRHEVVAVTEKMTTGEPYFVETGHVVPARLTSADRDAVAAEAVRALTAIGHQTGPSHVEVVIGLDGPRIIEVNRRLGGDRIWELVQLATGRDIMTESLFHAIGFDVERPGRPHRAAAIRFVLPGENTFGESISARDCATVPEGVVRIHLDADARDRSEMRLRSSHDRLGYVLATNETPVGALSAAESGLTVARGYLQTSV